METFLEYETVCHEPPPGHVFVGSLAEIDPRKVVEVVRVTRDKICKNYGSQKFLIKPNNDALCFSAIPLRRIIVQRAR